MSEIITASKWLLAMCVLSTLCSCATNGSTLIGGERDIGNDERIAIDLISTLIQIPGYDPYSTTVRFNRNLDVFGNELHNALSASGYGVQLTDTLSGENYVYYSLQNLSDPNVSKYIYTVSIGTVTISREYLKRGSNLFPSSEIVIKGAKPQFIAVNDDIYRQQGGNVVFPSGVVFLDATGNILQASSDYVEIRKQHKRVDGEKISKERFLILAKAQIFTNDRITSEWSRTFNTLEPLHELAVVFDNNEFRLGMPNKMALSHLADLYIANEHAFELFACNHGRSLSYDGTESMALGRSLRIKEELLTLGVDLSDIKENGCFISDIDKNIPKGGAIVTFNQRT